jgi:hypothetical protein
VKALLHSIDAKRNELIYDNKSTVSRSEGNEDAVVSSPRKPTEGNKNQFTTGLITKAD